MQSHFQKSNDSGLHYIIDTDIGGDIDDSLALLVVMAEKTLPLAITTNHIETREKAQIAKCIMTECGHPEIPVFAGVGCKRNDSPEQFAKQNSLFPPMFGHPNPKANKVWHTKHAVAYQENYGHEFASLEIEHEPAPKFIARLAKQFSPQHKLTIITLGPLHNIETAIKLDPTIADSIKLYAMGGGYNWLISPETSAFVLARIETVCISSEFIVKNQFFITPNELEEIEKREHSRLGKTIFEDWKNWHKTKAGHFNTHNTNLYDPVALFLALHPHYITVTEKRETHFPCLDEQGKLKQEYVSHGYRDSGLEGKIITYSEGQLNNVSFVKEVSDPEEIRKQIIAAISARLTCHLQTPSHSASSIAASVRIAGGSPLHTAEKIPVPAEAAAAACSSSLIP